MVVMCPPFVYAAAAMMLMAASIHEDRKKDGRIPDGRGLIIGKERIGFLLYRCILPIYVNVRLSGNTCRTKRLFG